MNKTPPAEGERRAAGGLYPQYRVSGSLILRSLINRTLEWIRIADPKAGRVDDFQICSSSRIDAYQIKWSIYAGNFTFNDLNKRDTPPLINQLSDGWKRLKGLNPGKRVVVHLVTNDMPSTSSSQKKPTEPIPPSPYHFAAFIEQVWKPAHKDINISGWKVKEEWQQTWVALRNASGLTPDEFEAFVPDCELEFGYKIPGSDIADDEESLAHLKHLTESLFGSVADPEKLIELDLEQLLRRLGWEGILDYRYPHRFPVDEKLYYPIEESVSELKQRITELPGGYIALMGSPGSGKSTLLTQTMRDLPVPARVIYYYAFVPDSQDSARGESENFLHDVVVALSRADSKFLTGGIPGLSNRTELSQYMSKQLEKAHQDWEETGTKTIILVDGLDHIQREYDPERSLLKDLPDPDRICDGVYFVLGSQTDQLEALPARVKYEIKQAARRVRIKELPRNAVNTIIGNAGLTSVLSEKQKENVYTLSEGHPLALVYLLNHLKDQIDENEVDNILKETLPYDGAIERQYYSYWERIEADTHGFQLVNLLGLVARLRRVIDLSRIKKWADPMVVDRFCSLLSHYFRKETSDRWYFFHNSFRIFLEKKTAEFSGMYNPKKGLEFHEELAKRCADEDINSPLAWERLFHLFNAQKHDEVLKLATSEWFREQFYAFRPADAIQQDVALAIQSAASQKDSVATVRLILTGMELYMRQEHLEMREISIPSLLIRSGDAQIAVEYLRDGNSLRVFNEVNTKEALLRSIELKSIGFEEEATRLFKLAEPLDLLYGSKSIEENHIGERGKLLEAWARAAVHFHPLNHTIEMIRRIRLAGDRYGRESADTLTRRQQNRMLYYAGLELLDLTRAESLSMVRNSFDISNPEDIDWWFWLNAYSWGGFFNLGDNETAKRIFEETLAKVSGLNVGFDSRIRLAEGLYNIQGDEESAWKWVQNVNPSEAFKNILEGDSEPTPFESRFRLYRLLYALGKGEFASRLFSESVDPKDQGIIIFEKGLCSIAEIWGEAWRGNQIQGFEIRQKVFPLLRLFNRDGLETNHWNKWHNAFVSADAFYRRLINAVEQHGSRAIEILKEAFEQEWDNPDIKRYWHPSKRRQVLIELYHTGQVDSDWIITKLAEIEKEMLEWCEDISAKLEECQEQADAWLELKDDYSAKQCLTKMLRSTMGVGYHKDYQLDTWIKFLGEIVEREPEKAAERISWFAKVLVPIKPTTEGDAPRYAAEELLKVTYKWSPRHAIRLFNWFTDKELIWYHRGLVLLLEEMLKSKPPPTELITFFLTEVLLSTSGDAYPILVAHLISNILNSQEVEEAIATIYNLLAKIDIFGLPSTRKPWKQAIARELQDQEFDLNQVGLDVAYLQPDDMERNSSEYLKLQTGSKILSMDEVIKRVSSISDLKQFLDNEAKDSYFNWVPIVEHLAEILEPEELLSLKELMKDRSQLSNMLAGLSEKMLTCGYKKQAWELGEQALEKSDYFGWDVHFSGGSRIAALRALMNVDQPRALEHVYEVLNNDFLSSYDEHNYWFASTLARNLNKIVPLLSEEVPWKKVWGEVESYLGALFDNYELPNDNPWDDSRKWNEDTPIRAAIDLYVCHLRHPISAIFTGTQRAIIKLLLIGNQDMQRVVKECLDAEERLQERIMMVLEAVSLKDTHVVSMFKDKFIQLCESPNYVLRVSARNILKRIGEQIPSPSALVTKLPSTYNLSFPPHRVTNIVRGPVGVEIPILLSSDEPAEIIDPFGKQFHQISQITRFTDENLHNRAVQIIKDFAPQESWSKEGELRIGQALQSTGLEFFYMKPRVELARRAMFHIIAELIDAGELDEDNFAKYKREFRFYDPALLLVEHERRSESIPPMSKDIKNSLATEEWLNSLEQGLDLIRLRFHDGRLILAEDTSLKRPVWKVPTETRQGYVHISKTPDLKQDMEKPHFEYRIMNHLVQEYPNLGILDDPLPLILCHNVYWYDTPGTNWIALNPLIGYELGWTLSSNGLFRWINEEGATMVESIWWQDGLSDHRPPLLDDEIGEGWLVIASPEAVAKIQSCYNTLAKFLFLGRQFNDNSDKKENKISKIIGFPDNN